MELAQHEASEFTARLQGRMVADNSELKTHKSQILFPFIVTHSTVSLQTENSCSTTSYLSY